MFHYSALQVTCSMKDQTLADVNDDLVKTGKFLSTFTGEKLRCVMKFSQCQEIVKWIKETTEGE